MNEIIKVRNLSFGYTEQLVLDNLDFHLNRGDFLALIGSNGSGKSTLFKLLINELQPRSGIIQIFNEDIRLFQDWPKIGYVAQVPVAHNDFPATVREVVRVSLYSKMRPLQFYNKHHEELTINALKKVGMEEYIDRPITKLSRGQQQRVMIARVIISEPEIMLLDEPTSGVDNVASESIYQLLKKLNTEENISIILVTHDLDNVIDYANRVVCIDNKCAYELSEEEKELEVKYRHKHPNRYKVGGNNNGL